jgi:TolB protein
VFASSGNAQDPRQEAHEAAWVADGKRLVFAGKGAQSQDVFAANIDGSHVVQVTRDAYVDYYPTMSADGRRIAYVSVRDSVMRLIVVDADGSNTRDIGIVTAVGRNLNPVPPSWSPDGKRLVYATNRNGAVEVFVVNANGTDDTRLAAGTLPEWSHNGQLIAYSFRSDSTFNIYVMRPDGGDQRRVTSVPSGSAIDASWTPDDQRLVYVWVRRDPSGAMNGQWPKNLNDLHVVDVAGLRDESLGDTPEAEYEPRVSPDGNWIIYLKEYMPAGATKASNVLFIRSFDGKEIRKLFVVP